VLLGRIVYITNPFWEYAPDQDACLFLVHEEMTFKVSLYVNTPPLVGEEYLYSLTTITVR
jgi:hypothetical protein